MSKFVAVGATHINSTVNAHGIVTAAFKNPNGQEVLVANNTNTTSTTFETICNGQESFSYTLPAGATATFEGTVPAATVLSSTPAASHVFKIISRGTDKPFGISGGSTANSAKAVQFTDDGDLDQQYTIAGTGNSNQQWQITANGSWYTITNRTSGLPLNLTGGSLANNAAIQQYASSSSDPNAQWQFVPVS